MSALFFTIEGDPINDGFDIVILAALLRRALSHINCSMLFVIFIDNSYC